MKKTRKNEGTNKGMNKRTHERTNEQTNERTNESVICVAAVKSRLVLHHCVVIYFWSTGIMECTCMLFTFENGVPLMR